MLPWGKLYWTSDFSTKSPTFSILGMYWFLINFAKIVMWLNTETSYWLEKDGNHCCDKWKPVIMYSFFFSSPDPKGHVSYCHHMASVVRRNFLQKSSPLKVLDQWKPNLVWIITRASSFKIVSGDAVHQATWLLLLKIEHMIKLQVLGNNSKTFNNIKNLN